MHYFNPSVNEIQAIKFVTKVGSKVTPATLGSNPLYFIEKFILFILKLF